MSTKEQRELWTRLRGFITEDQMRELAFNAVPVLLQDVEQLTAALEAARAGICTIYHLIDFDEEIKAMKHCKNVTDPIDAAIASVRK